MTHQIIKTFQIPEEYKDLRLDQAIAKALPEYSRSKIKSWIDAGELLVDQKQLKPKEKVLGGEIITLHTELEDETHHEAEKIDLNIVYEDDDLIVINKPAGMVVHPAAGNRQGTMLNALLHHCPALSKLPRAGIVHRLDKDTSGLLVIAKTLPAYTSLVKQLQKRVMSREYETVVIGEMISGGTIDAPIGRHPRHRTHMAVVDSGKPAVTHYRVSHRFANYTHITVTLETGRTHQIRVHMAHIHHPIVGDPTYAGRLKIPKNAPKELIEYLQQFKRQALHARKLGLRHPTKKEWIEWQAPLPKDMQQLLKMLSNAG